MAAWLQALVVLVGGGVVVSIVALARRWAKESGASDQRAEQAEQDLAAAQHRADEARRSEDVRHETDRGDFSDVVDRL